MNEDILSTVNAEPEQAVAVQNNSEVDDSVNQEQPEVTSQVPAKPVQTPEENAKFAEMRRKTEAAQADAKRIQAEHEALLNTLRNSYGYQGSAQDIADALEAQQLGLSVDDIKLARQADEQRIQAAMINDPEYIRSQAELHYYRKQAYEAAKANDFKLIKEKYPDMKETSVDDLGDDYVALRALKIDPVVSYAALQANKKPIPPSIGMVNNTSTAAERDYFTSKEVDKLTPDQLRNPEIQEKIWKSMTKWK